MTTDWLTTLSAAGSTVYDVFLLPGDFLLLQFGSWAPEIALLLGVDVNSHAVPLSAALSVLIWLLVIGALWKFLRFLQNLSRSLTAACGRMVFRVSLRMHRFKAELLCLLGKMLGRQHSDGIALDSEAVIDDSDLAVLQNTAAAGGSFVVAAPDLAAQLTLRPAQVQRSLERLRAHGIIDAVLGSTDGYQNYRLSLSGAAFLAALERKESTGALDGTPSPAMRPGSSTPSG